MNTGIFNVHLAVKYNINFEFNARFKKNIDFKFPKFESLLTIKISKSLNGHGAWIENTLSSQTPTKVRHGAVYVTQGNWLNNWNIWNKT